MAVAIPIIVILVVAVATTIVLAANRQRGTTGLLSRETKHRDSGAEARRGRRALHLDRARDDRARARRRDARAAAACRPSAAAATSRVGSRSTRRSSASSRRQFLNRGLAATVGFSVAGFGAACLGFLWPTGSSRLRRQDQRRQDRRHHRRDPGEGRALLHPRGTRLRAAVPRGGPPGREEGLQRGHVRGHGAGLRRAVPALRPPRMPRAVVPELAVVRVPVPRLEVQPRRREEGRPGSPRSRPVRDHRGRRHASPINTGDIELGPPIGTNTTGQQQEGPLCV